MNAFQKRSKTTKADHTIINMSENWAKMILFDNSATNIPSALISSSTVQEHCTGVKTVSKIIQDVKAKKTNVPIKSWNELIILKVSYLES